MATDDQSAGQDQAQGQQQPPSNGGRGGRGRGSSLQGNSSGPSSFANPDEQDLNEQGAATGTQGSMQRAMERELAGQQVFDYEAPYDEKLLGPTGVPLIWVASNRADNRAVGFWLDEHQPGGQVFLGPGVELVARTPDIEALLNQHVIIEVPEPRRWRRDPETGDDMRDEQGRRIPNPKYPAAKVADPTRSMAAQPGRPAPLGRNFDPDLFDEEQLQEIRRRQARAPRELPAPMGGVVPGVTHPIS